MSRHPNQSAFDRQALHFSHSNFHSEMLIKLSFAHKNKQAENCPFLSVTGQKMSLQEWLTFFWFLADYFLHNPVKQLG
jgi:hypothetical protein